MADWEFLIQQEGDRSWLPLDSPDVEILEGRYRVVARSSRINTPVDIRIIHRDTLSTPPKQLSQKHSRQTNELGLIVVIPFTHLQPGSWELQCNSADLMADLLGDRWQHSVRLQVLAHHPEEDWEGDWPSSHGNSHISRGDDAFSAESATPLQESDPQWVSNQAMAEPLNATVNRLLQMTENLPDVPDEADSSPLVPHKPVWLTAGSSLVVQLDQSDWMVDQEDPLEITGSVILLPAEASATAHVSPEISEATPVVEANESRQKLDLDQPELIPQSLHLYLRDPQTLQVLARDRQPLPVQSPPVPFTFRVRLPLGLRTHLLLGEIAIYGSQSQSADSHSLASQFFTVTVNPDDLLGELNQLSELLAQQPEADPIQLPLLQDQQVAASLTLSFLDQEAVEAESPPAAAPEVRAASNPVLPPQLFQAEPEKLTHASLQLPSFNTIKPFSVDRNRPTSRNQSLLSMPVSPSARLDSPPVADPVSAPTDAPATTPPAAETTTSDPLFAALPSVSEAEAVETASPVTESSHAVASEFVEPVLEVSDPTPQPTTSSAAPPAESPQVAEAAPTPPPLDVPSPTRMAFKALKLQDRFLARLTSLATDPALADWLLANPQEQPTSIDSYSPLTNPEQVLLAQEVVVEDDQPAPGNQASLNGQSGDSFNQLPETLSAVSMDETPSLPTPTIEVMPGDLTAGQTIDVQVRLPYVMSRISIKLWILDCQTRSLLDGPRWIIDLAPDGFGNLVASSQITVPFGSTEIQLEAIAVELHSRQESRKAIATRTVVPPYLPIFSLDDLSDRL